MVNTLDKKQVVLFSLIALTVVVLSLPSVSAYCEIDLNESSPLEYGKLVYLGINCDEDKLVFLNNIVDAGASNVTRFLTVGDWNFTVIGQVSGTTDTELITVVDTTEPVVTINTPENTTYVEGVNDTIYVDIEIDDLSADVSEVFGIDVELIEGNTDYEYEGRGSQFDLLPTSITDNLIVYYAFEEDLGSTIVVDKMNYKNGSIVKNTGGLNQGTVIQGVEGIIGSAYSFEGGYINLSNDLNSIIYDDDEYSIGFWFKSRRGVNERLQAFYGCLDNDYLGGSWFTTTVDNQIAYNSPTSTAWNSISGSFVIDDREWHHLAIVHNTTNRILYIDGVEVSSLAGKTDQAPDNDLIIGAVWHLNLPLDQLDGYMDEFMISNESWTSEDMQIIYDNGIKRQGAGLTYDELPSSISDYVYAYYSFESMQGNNVIDSTGNYNATLINYGNVQLVDGVRGNAFNFNLNGAVNISNSEGFNDDLYEADEVNSFSLWYKTNEIGKSSRNRMTLIGSIQNSFQYGFLVYLRGDSYDDYSIQVSSFKSNDTGEEILDGRWHHLVITTAPNNLSIYEDGEYLTSFVISNILTVDNGLDLYIGGRNKGDSAVSDRFNGSMDEIIFINKTLTLEEVRTLYNYKNITSEKIQGNYNLSYNDVYIRQQNLTVFATDLYSNIGSEELLFSLNEENPITLNITNPDGSFEVTTSGEVVDINWTVEGDYVAECWYQLSNDTIETNYSVACQDNYTTISYPLDNPLNLTFTLYASDDFGDIVSDNILLYQTGSPNLTLISPSDGFIVTQYNETISLNWSVNDSNLDSCVYNLEGLSPCYQETANASHPTDGNCGLNYGGSYVTVNGWNTSTIDGDWTTFSDITPSDGTVTVIYNKPEGYNSAEIKVKMINSSFNGSYALTQDCWDLSEEYVKIKITTSSLSRGLVCCKVDACVGAFDRDVLYSDSLGGSNGILWEEGILWGYDEVGGNTTVNCQDNHTTFNYPTSNPDNLTVTFFALDTLENEGSDSSTIYKNTIPPTLNITYPIGKVEEILYNEDNISLNWTINSSGALDSCWYSLNGGSNIILDDCYLNYSLITLNNYTDDNIILYANDTLGNEVSDSQNWSYYVFIQNVTSYSNVVGELSQQTYSLNIELPDSDEIQSASFYYDDVEYPADINLNGNSALLQSTINTPSVDVNTNFSFYWEFSINPVFQTDPENQTVIAMNVDDCSNYSELIINYTLIDEVTETVLNGVNSSIEIDLVLSSLDGEEFLTYYNIYDDTPYASVCIEELLNGTEYYLDIVTSYVAEDYVQEFWFLDDGLLTYNNDSLNDYVTKNVTLRLLTLDESTTFLFKYYNEFYNIVPNAVVSVLRYYIGQGIFKEAERCQLDNNGECHLHLVEEDVIYRFRITSQGELEHLSDEYNAKCLETLCQINLQKDEELQEWDDEYDNLEEGTYTLTSDSDTREVTLAFNLQSTGTMDLEVYEYDQDAESDTLVGSDSVIAKSGTATVTINPSYGNKTYYAVIKHNDGFVSSQWVDMNESGFQYFGTLGLFLAGLLVLSLGLIAVSSGAWTVVFLVFGILVASITKLVEMDYYLLMWVVSAGALLVWKLSTRRTL